MLHSIITPATQPCDATRAQLIINSHIAQIDAAIQVLRGAKGKLPASIYTMHNDKLNRLRRALIHDLDSVLAAPGGAKHFCGKWGPNLYGPNVLSACEAVDSAIASAPKADAYRTMLAARRAGLAVVR